MTFIMFLNRVQYYFCVITSVGMSVIYILLAVSVVVAIFFFVAFILAVIFLFKVFALIVTNNNVLLIANYISTMCFLNILIIY